jgi:spore coat protein CotH
VSKRLKEAAIVVVFVLAAVRASAQTAEELFDASILHDVQILMNSRELALLHERFDENTYYPADIIWRGVRVRGVGVRSRGFASRSPVKPALHIVMDRYATGRRFLGMRSLVLDNLVQDAGMVREQVAMSFITRMGEPAPRESLARLHVNGTNYGVYAIVEDIEVEFLARTFADGSGHLFEHHLIDPPYNFEDLGDELGRYVAVFEARTRETDPAAVAYGPIRDLARDINEDDASWRARVERGIDLPQFVRMVALESFLAEDDGLLGFWGMHNFYLYRTTAAPAHRFIAWDRDKVFREIDQDIFLRAQQNVLFHRALREDDLRALFLDTLEACARLASEDRWLERQIRDRAAVIAAATHHDVRKPFSNAEYDSAIEFFILFAQHRSAVVLAQVRAARRLN